MDRPNILIVMTDHQRGDTVLPEHPAQTPNLSRLADESLYFTETFCPSPHCCPARATFHSGLYPSRTGIWNNVLNGQSLGGSLKPGVRLWSEDLADAGYDMHFFGKWHVCADERPRDRGWAHDEHATAVGSQGDHHGQTWEHYRKVAQIPDPTERAEGQVLRPGWGPNTVYGSYEVPAGQEFPCHDGQVTRAACAAMPGFGAEGQPWCAFVGLIGPHDPYVLPKQFVDLYEIEEVPLPRSYHDRMLDKPGLYRKMRRQVWDQLSEREIREGVRHFWAYCTYLDHLFGQLMATLEATGQADNTLVLFCSDHGDYCGEHGLFCKGIPAFRGAYHVPAVVRWPKGLRARGKRCEHFVSLADFAPTFLDLAGVSVDREFSGRSLVPFLQGEKPAGWRDAIFTQCDGTEIYATQRTVTTDKYKLVYNGFDEDELYDRWQDPDEVHNLAGDPRYEDVRRDLWRRLWQFAHEQDDQATNAYITVALTPYGPAEAFRE